MDLLPHEYVDTELGAKETLAVFRVQYAHWAPYLRQIEQVHSRRERGLCAISIWTAPQWQEADNINADT